MITKRIEKKLDENYIRILQTILNKSLKQHPTKQQLYGYFPSIFKTIKVKWTRPVGHCWRSKDELISDALLWTPTRRRASVGRPGKTCLRQLNADSPYNLEDLLGPMDERDGWMDEKEGWRERVREIRTVKATWRWWWCFSRKNIVFFCKVFKNQI